MKDEIRDIPSQGVKKFFGGFIWASSGHPFSYLTSINKRSWGDLNRGQVETGNYENRKDLPTFVVKFSQVHADHSSDFNIGVRQCIFDLGWHREGQSATNLLQMR